MEKTAYIHLEEFCVHYNIEMAFVLQLQEYEIVRIETTNDQMMIPDYELSKLEKMVRLHHDLAINPEGLHAIFHLLQKVDQLQNELMSMQRTLNRLEH